MLNSIRRNAALGAVAAVAAATLVVPAAASAKTHHVKLAFAGKQSGINLTANISGAPLGHCTMKGKLVIPDTQQVWTCKGGTISITGHGTTGASNDTKGTWKITKGTGKFKNATGSGTMSGKLSTGKYTYVGTMKF